MIATVGAQFGPAFYQTVDIDPIERGADGQSVSSAGLDMVGKDLHIANIYHDNLASEAFLADAYIEESNEINGVYSVIPNRSFIEIFHEFTPALQLWIFTDWKHPDRKRFARVRIKFNEDIAIAQIIGASCCGVTRNDGVVTP